MVLGDVCDVCRGYGYMKNGLGNPITCPICKGKGIVPLGKVVK